LSILLRLTAVIVNIITENDECGGYLVDVCDALALLNVLH